MAQQRSEREAARRNAYLAHQQQTPQATEDFPLLPCSTTTATAASAAATAAASPTPRATSAATSAISTAISHSSLAAHRSVRQRHSADVEPLQLLSQSPPRTPTSPSARAPTAALTTDCSCDAAIAAALNADATTHPAAPATAQRLTSTTTTLPAAPAAAQRLTSTTSTPGGTTRKHRTSSPPRGADFPPALPPSLTQGSC